MLKKFIKGLIKLDDFVAENLKKVLFVLWIIFLAITCIVITETNNWENLFCYQMEEYKLLESQGKEIIQTSDYNREGYTCIVTEYNLKTDVGEIKIEKDGVSLSFKVDNGKIEVNSYRKIKANQLMFLTLLVFVPMLVSCIAFLVCWSLYYMLYYICLRIEKKK